MSRSSIVLALLAAACSPAAAQIKVHPTGVNVNAQGATTVLLTFGPLRGQQAVDATWCGRLVSAVPDRGLRCDPAAIFGRLPLRYDRSRASGEGGFTDVMSIPASVARRAYQAAERGERSSFFYVRRFVNAAGGPDEYVAVTCRLTGGGARSPLSLTDVQLLSDDAAAPVLWVRPGAAPASFNADVTYTGTGRLAGRWEVVLPGEELPTEADLLTEGSLPLEQRGLQRRYRQVERFNLFLPPTGRITIPGPDPQRLPTDAEGAYLVLLRVEAADDKEGDTDPRAVGVGDRVVHGGAAAGFPMPVLRYVVSQAGEAATSVPRAARELALLRPADGAAVAADSALRVSWLPERTAAAYRVELAGGDGVSLLRAVLPASAVAYDAPPWLRERANGGAVRWRVLAIDATGREVRASEWRSVSWAP